MTYKDTDTNNNQKMIQHKYGFVNYKKEIDFTTSTPIPLSKYGIADPIVVESVESKRNEEMTLMTFSLLTQKQTLNSTSEHIFTVFSGLTILQTTTPSDRGFCLTERSQLLKQANH